MVQKSKKASPPPRIDSPVEPKRRGRPRAYQPDIALGKALDLFRKDGFAATSLDDLSAATGMNRPSLYGAFGDKRDLYIKSLQRYREESRAAMRDALDPALPLREVFRRVYASALKLYLAGDSGPRGCFSVSTAAPEALADPEIRAMVSDGIREADKASGRRIRLARERGEPTGNAAPEALAQLATAAIHTLAVRARAGVPRAELEAIAAHAIDMICGPVE